MIISSLALVLCSCLGSCTPIAEAKNYEELQSAATEMINEASEDFDYEGFDLSFSDQESLIKQKLHQYAEENKLYTVDELADLKQSIELDDDYRNFGNIDSLFIKKENNKDDVPSLGGGIFNKDQSSIKDQTKNDGVIKKDNITGPNLDYGDTSGTAKETYFFPELKNDLNKATIATNYTIDGSNFFGVYCSKEACVGLYNFFANWINKQTIYRISGSGTPLQVAAEALRTLSVIATAEGLSFCTISNTITTIVSSLAEIWQTFVGLLSGSAGIIGFIVGLIIFAVGVACITTFVTMIVCGHFGKGFAAGWKIGKNLHLDWYIGFLN